MMNSVANWKITLTKAHKKCVKNSQGKCESEPPNTLVCQKHRKKYVTEDKGMNENIQNHTDLQNTKYRYQHLHKMHSISKVNPEVRSLYLII